MTTTTTPPTRGSNAQPSLRTHKAAHNRTRMMKKAVEQFKTLRRVFRLTPGETSTLAYFTQPMGRND